MAEENVKTSVRKEIFKSQQTKNLKNTKKQEI